MKNIHILGIAGSLRQGSYNRACLKAAGEMLPPNVTFEIFPLNEIPVYNQDNDSQLPQVIKDFKAKIRAADALLIATPEYNHSVSGVLKNAMDYVSRPYGDNPFNGKPVAMMSASTGMVGAVRAQIDLKHTFVFLNMYDLNQPEVIITFAAQKIDDKGRLTDEKTRDIIKQQVAGLADFARRLNP